MENRREWIAARTDEICRVLGYPRIPPVVFESGSWGLPVEFETIIREGRKRILVDEPRVLVSPEALDSLGEPELRYWLALALIDMDREDGLRLGMKVGLIMMPWPAAALVAVVACVARWGWMGLLALPAVPLAIPLGFPFSLRVVDADTIRRHLRAIELTGDAASGVAVLRKIREGQPKGLSYTLLRLRGRAARDLPARLQSEAEELGYRTEALPNK